MSINITGPQAPVRVELDEQYLLVAEANRRAYSRSAASYLADVECVNDPIDQSRLDSALGRALDHLRAHGAVVPGETIVALDACGGAGNAALKLLRAGCRVVLSDITSELISVYSRECDRGGFACETRCGEIASYLGQTDDRFHLVVFSSALHHLHDPVMVLKLAERVLVPGGMVVTIFDPIRQPRWLRAIREPARLLARAARHPSLVLTRARPVLKRLLSGGGAKHRAARLALTDDNIGNIAEFHADTGFDDVALSRTLAEQTGYRVVHHERFIGACPALEGWLLRVLNRPNAFGFLLERRPEPAAAAT